MTNTVLNNVQALLEKQTAKGVKKYGQAVQANDLAIEEWIDHTMEELVDTLVYLECIKQRVKSYER